MINCFFNKRTQDNEIKLLLTKFTKEESKKKLITYGR